MTALEAKILVADDEQNVLMTLQAILQEDGYVVDTASDGNAAVQAIRSRQYDLVLTDLKMPGVDGLGVLAEVKNSSPNTVTLMMTGYGSVDSALEAVQLGAYEYLLKPMEVADLKQAVRRSLERKHLSEVEILYRVSRAVTGSLDRDKVASEIAEAARQFLGIASARIVSFRTDGIVDPLLEWSYIFGTAHVRPLLERGEVITEADNRDELRGWQEAQKLKSFAIVPGLSQGNLVCALIAHNNGEPYEFHASALRFLQALSGQCALVLSNALMFAQLKQKNAETEAANRKLRELDKMKSQFLSIATHELRTPLTIIMGYSAMLSEQVGDRLSEDEQELLRESVLGCQRLIRLVNSMLDVSRIEAGKMTMQLAESDLSGLVRDVVKLFQPEAAKRQIHLSLELPVFVPPLIFDSDRIEQVVINLISNALKFTPAGGSVHVAVYYSEETQAAQIAVQDTGIGIAAEDQAIIFDEFAQVQKHARSRQQDGSGLGLAIAKRIVEAHAGKIILSSQPGVGSTFTFTIPGALPTAGSSTAVPA
jgi:signal transduction histidine kinase/CheY-like chemotaxis protein